MSKRCLKEVNQNWTVDCSGPSSKRQRIDINNTLKPSSKSSYSTKAEWYIRKDARYGNHIDDGQDTKLIQFSDADNIKIETFFQKYKGKVGAGSLSITSDNIHYAFYIDKDNKDHGLVCITPIATSDRIVVDRQEIFELSDIKDNNMINKLTSNLTKLAKKSNIKEWIQYSQNADLDCYPIVLFDFNKTLQTEKEIMNTLTECDIVSHFNDDVLRIITKFVCNDNKFSINDCDRIISNTIGCDTAYNCYNIETTKNCCGKDMFDGFYSNLQHDLKTRWTKKNQDGGDQVWIFESGLEWGSKPISVQDIKNKLKEFECNDLDEDNDEDKILDNERTFQFMQYALDNLHDCKWIELLNRDRCPLYWILIGKAKTKSTVLVGMLFEYWTC